MSRSSDSATRSQQTYLIPSVLTNSARAILDAFGDDIISLTARGSVETTNQTVIESLRQYGVSREQRTNHRLSLEYERLRGTDGPKNSLTTSAQEEILEEVEAILAVESNDVKPDLAVTSFTVRITNEQLQEVTPAQTPEFDLRFIADPAEPAIREPTKRLNVERGLYSDLGFKITNLNLHSVIETETKYHQQSDGRYLSWRGPEDIRPRSPKKLAVRINNSVLPDRYGTLKRYFVTDDRILELDEQAVDAVDDPFRGTNSTEESQ